MHDCIDRRRFIVGLGAAMLEAPKNLAGGKIVNDQIFELRQYTLFGGKRDRLIDIFEQNLVESQEELGIDVVGTFCDLNDPDRFVWIRGFPDMEARGKTLQAFYMGPVWQKHRDAANATMLDSNNVLLLRSASGQAFVASTGHRSGGGVYGVTIHYLRSTESARFAAFYEDTIAPRLRAMTVLPIAVLTTEPAANNFPRLPVRERDSAFVWIARWPNERAHLDFAAQYHRWSGWRDAAPAEVLPALMEKPEILRLKPTLKSRLQ